GRLACRPDDGHGPARARTATLDRAIARRPARPLRGLRLAMGRVHHGPPLRGGRHVVTEAAALLDAPRRLDPRTGMAALADVADPGIAAVSVVELGMIERIDVEPDRVRVELLPTFVGCPALEMIRAAVTERLREFGRPVEVETSFATPWTSDRISPAGRKKL